MREPPYRSRLHHGLVAPCADRLAHPGGPPALFDVNAVIVRELQHRCLNDRRRGDAEATERELLHVVAELAEPLGVAVASEAALHALEDPGHARGPDAAGYADAAGLLREVREQLRRLGDDARRDRNGAHLRRAHVRSG